MDLPRVYLAGPIVFYEDPNPFFDAMKEICAHHGLIGVAPLDNQIGLEGLAPGKQTITAIVAADYELMPTLDGAIFCLDPFRRSTEMDPGTAVEIGFMCALKKPMAGWTIDGRSYPEKVHGFFKGEGITHTAANATGGTSGNERDLDGVLIHSEGCVQNGMAHCGIELAGGKVFAHQDWKRAFEAAVMHLAREQFKCEPKTPLYSENQAFMDLAV
jgi:nucleoside 2-deoxyribosyltransferase